MKPHLPNPFKPSKYHIVSTLVSKVACLLNHSLTLKQAKELHGLIVVTGLNYLEPMLITQCISIPLDNNDSSVDTSIVSYVRSLVHCTKHANVASRASWMEFLYRRGEFREALGEYVSMRRLGGLPCRLVVACGINACRMLGDQFSGSLIHGHVHGYGFIGDVHVGTALMGFYSKVGDVENVRKVFAEMAERNAVSRLIKEYLESGNVSMAERLFFETGNKDVDTWSTMVSWYTRTGDMEKAIATFAPMPVKTSSSWVAMVGGYVDCGNMEIARNFHDVMPEENVASCVKMIDEYSKKGLLESAREVFNEMNEKDHLVYNAMITCYAKNGWLREALQLFDEMLQPDNNIRPDNETLATVISICSQWGNLGFASWIENTLVKEMKITMNDELATVFIDLYAKCGRVDKAYGLFCSLQKKDVDVYTTLILACSRNGWKHDAIKLFEEMLEANICPSLVAFSGLLTALNHGFESANPSSTWRPLNHLGRGEESY